MTSTVKNVFLVIGASILAFFLYFTFFGFYDLNGVYMGAQDKSGQGWRGALFYAADNVQLSMSKYYYDYCYLPTYQSDYYVDEALGGSSVASDLLTVPTDLSFDSDLWSYSGSSHYGESWR